MSEELMVLADGSLMGRVVRSGQKLAFGYDASWLENPEAFPLSLSMPMVVIGHGHAVIEPFLWGLLPDNESVLERWGRRFHVSPRNVFQLLAHVGEDVAGALQFVRPGRMDDMQGIGETPTVDWLDDAGLEERLQLLLADASAGRLSGDGGQFSLAGAQPKTALYLDHATGRWGVPKGRTPTTHIFKPATGAFDGFAENEHFCLRLASGLGLPAATSRVIRCGGVKVIVARRYDREFKDGRVHRLHQEDLCQALATRPQIKYQNQGGPSVKDIAGVLWDQSSQPLTDIWDFADALALNWLTAGTDAHAKNFSLLLGPSGHVRLAPLYDLASSLPYPRHISPQKAALAMRIGRDYRVRDIRRSNWEACARELRLPVADVLDRIVALANRLPAIASDCAASLVREGLDGMFLTNLTDALEKHVQRCRAMITADSRK